MVRRQPGQGQPAEVLRRTKILRRGLVQLGQRGVRIFAQIFAQPGLEKPGERDRQRLARLSSRSQVGEVAVSLGVRRGQPRTGWRG